jgi:hypothetical protein
MKTENFSKGHLLAAISAGLAVFLFSSAMGLPSFSYASQQTSLSINPFFKLPGGTALVSGQGFAPNSNLTLYVKNVVARVETQEAGASAKIVTYPGQITAGTTETNSDGTFEWALGVPKDEVKVIERWISNSTGQEEVLRTVTTTYTFQGTVQVIAQDDVGNHASGELTIIRWISESPFG